MINLEYTTERLQDLLESGEDKILQEELNLLHPADLAEIFESLSASERLKCFQLLNDEHSADLLEELNPQYQVELLSEINEEKAARIIMNMPNDSVADVLGDLSDSETEAYLNKLPNRISSQIRELMSYKEDSAGGIMTSEVLTVEKDMTVEEALSFIRVKADTDKIELYYIYVVDKSQHLLGVLSLRLLITSPPFMRIEEIMVKDIIKVGIDEDQEIVADTLIKYGFLAVPVVDHYGRLKGMVTWDDAQEVNEEETTEEIYASSGISTDVIDEDEILSGHLFQAIRARTPWLFITLIGEFCAVNVANHFDHTLHAIPIIAIFMPLLAGLGGNIGTQSITLMVRGLSTGQVTLASAFHHIFRELRIGLSIGVFFGILVTAFTWNWQHSPILGCIVGTAMAINMTMATIIGTVTPFLLKKLNTDPAVASGPVIATTIDVLGLAVYFTLVTLSLKYLI